MPVHPIAQAILDIYRPLPPPEEVGVEAARERSRAMTKLAPRGPEVRSIEERVADCGGVELPLRIYRPEGPGPFPVVVYFHGGGYVLGDLETGDAHCRAFCSGARCVVVSVNYRHAPEHAFPAAVEDAYAATCWTAENLRLLEGDPQRLAVAGASAGATLAAVTALMARDRGTPRICFQLLLVPGTDMAHDFPSYSEHAEGFVLTRNTMRWFGRQYFKSVEDSRHPHASPLRASSLAGLPPATILTAEYDPMRDEGAAYAEALRAAGVRVNYKCYDGFIHLRLGPAADVDMLRDLRAAFGA